MTSFNNPKLEAPSEASSSGGFRHPHARHLDRKGDIPRINVPDSF